MLFNEPIFCFVTDQRLAIKKLLTLVEHAIQSGVNLVQFREKNADNKILREHAEKIKKITDDYNIPLLINDHVYLAAEIDAAGVHLGQNDISPLDARKILGPEKIIGLTINNLPQAEQDYPEVDYFGVGPVYPTKSKDDATPAIGIEELKKIAAILQKPYLVIGGITEKNIQELPSSIAGVAIISAISQANDPKDVCELIQEQLCNVIQPV